ncbi:hypothetical protein R69749_02825 [Paraburkholderia domus]|nr:hypothetical protein R75483_02232 [Paraburkholderia domus]CAE6805588.1 hypothetical protein R69749_02825 [Paraburkholderia domus]CAE6888329.1 hypothetical protein R70199_02957 [Paraburkholderia domus]
MSARNAVFGSGVKRLMTNKQRRTKVRKSRTGFSLPGRDMATHSGKIWNFAGAGATTQRELVSEMERQLKTR